MEIFIICLQIFLFRIIDVSLGVLRITLNVKKKPFFASVVGFFEVLIWFLIVRNALTADTGSLYITFAYALGFATGTYIGGILSKKLIKTQIGVHAITSSQNKEMLLKIRESGFPATVIEAHGNREEKRKRYLLIFKINSSEYKPLKELLLSLDEHAFIYVDELQGSVNGTFHGKKK